MIDIQDELYKDFEAVKQITNVSTMLDVICQTTGMGFAAIARVTDNRWLACSVRDEVDFGLKEGDELKVDTTLCSEIRDHRQPIVIDDFEKDTTYKCHHTPKIYGLQSYISIPIVLKNGEFFGTLCAISAKPAKVNNPKIIGMFNMFADLLSFYLQSLDVLERSYQANVELHHENRILANVNFDLDSFVYTASHDLKSPIANLEGLLDALTETFSKENLDRDEVNSIIKLMRSSIKRFAATIKDLTTIVEIDKNSGNEQVEAINLVDVVERIKQEQQRQIAESNASITVACEDDPTLYFSAKNFKSVMHNLISNAIKYRSPDRAPEILVRMKKVGGKTQLSVSDNGIGIPYDKQDKIFSMFKRFHDHVEGSGLGLYIVKRMIDNVKGQIIVESELNKGTTITIIF
ncbi:sensor histidine kinase [Pontibacter oryzae]|uniref:histidine kinase n=1 Tax=Pontibacter oryzae TaxID=2304593 RepID=A0A399S7R6_9BACT|nr:GAF domain-containing sensor histidine kinase [Pontibacter oryzae]RIJ37615.1 GAF domain-containing protein [Pontibacter oryzae]